MNTCLELHTGNAMSFQQNVRAYWAESKYELLRFVRAPACIFPTLLMPVLLYLLIGILVIGPEHEIAKLPIFMFSAFAVFTITSPGMYGIGQLFAIERQSGLLALKRTQPMPPAAYMIAKIICALVCVLVAMSLLIWLATSFSKIALDAIQIAQLFAVSLLGMAAFSAIGLFIGSLVSGSAAMGIINLVYFPMMYLSGTFFPLPEVLAPWAMIWPTFYLHQIFFAITLGESVISVPMCVAVLVGLTIVFAGLAAGRLSKIQN